MNRPSGSVDQIFRSSDGVLNVLTPQLYRSRDDGASWKNCQAPTGVNDLAVDRRGKLWIATSNALYGTTDEGSLWTAWNLGGAGVSDVLVSPFGTLVASTGHFRGVCVSSDFGATWSERNSGFPPEWWPPLIVQLWTDSSGTLYAQDDIPDRLFRLTAGTDSWVAVRPEFIVNKVGCMVITRNNTLYMTFDNTLIHRSHDRGEHWEPITRDLLPEGITKFAIAPDGRIYVGTAGAGVFRSRETVVSVEEPVSRPAPIDISVYPNPSKGRSRIRYMLPASGHVLIKIHDIMGREIASPLDAESGPGYHELEWDAVSLPAGAYLIRLSSGSFSRTVINFLLR